MAAQELCERVLPHDLDEQAKEKRHEQDEASHLDGVDGSGAHDGPVAVTVVVATLGLAVTVRVRLGRRVGPCLVILAVAVGALAEVMDVRLGIAHMAHGMQHGVEQQSHNNTHDHLEEHDREQSTRRLLVGEKHGDHLVGGGEDHGNQRARRHHSSRVERGRHGREAALRNRAEKPAHDGTRMPCTGNEPLHASLGGVLERLHGKVGHKQKRHELKCVQHGVGYDVDKHIQGLSSKW